MIKIKIDSPHLRGEEVINADEWTPELLREYAFLQVPLIKDQIDNHQIKCFGNLLFKLEKNDNEYIYRFYKFCKDLTREDVKKQLACFTSNDNITEEKIDMWFKINKSCERRETDE
jgi:hypothetical protein